MTKNESIKIENKETGIFFILYLKIMDHMEKSYF